MNHKFTRIDLEERTVTCSACGYRYHMGDAKATLTAAASPCPGKQENAVWARRESRPEVIVK